MDSRELQQEVLARFPTIRRLFLQQQASDAHTDGCRRTCYSSRSRGMSHRFFQSNAFSWVGGSIKVPGTLYECQIDTIF
jgi:hypothetical protein